MHANCPMHECGNTVWGPVVLWQHVQELLDPLMTQPEVKAPRGGRWAHTRWPLNAHRGEQKNRGWEHTALLRKTRSHARTVTTNVFNLYAWMQLPTNPKKSTDHRKQFFLCWLLFRPINFHKKGGPAMRGGRDVSAARSGGRARREKPQNGPPWPAHSPVPGVLG